MAAEAAIRGASRSITRVVKHEATIIARDDRMTSSIDRRHQCYSPDTTIAQEVSVAVASCTTDRVKRKTGAALRIAPTRLIVRSSVAMFAEAAATTMYKEKVDIQAVKMNAKDCTTVSPKARTSTVVAQTADSL